MTESSIIESYQKGITLKELSNTFQISVDRIRTILKKHNVFIPRKVYEYTNLPEQDIINHYKNDITIANIAKLYDTSISPIVKILTKHNIRKPNWLKRVPYKTMEKMLDKEYFNDIITEHISLSEIANHFNCGVDLINSLYDYHNIKKNSNSGEIRSLLNRKGRNSIEITYDNFIQLYNIEKNTLYDIAEKFGISNSHLRLYCKQWNIEVRVGYNKSDKYLQLKNDSDLLEELLNNKTVYDIADEYECCIDSIYSLVKKFNLVLPERYRSQAEIDIVEYLKSLGIDNILTNSRSIISPLELDIYLPDYKLAIEYCGLYWHSECHKDKNYHKAKLELCSNENIRLLTIFEDEWNNKEHIIKSKLNAILGLSNNRIYARKCKIIKNISVTEQKSFYNKTHIQGYGKGSIIYGLRYNDDIVAMMTFIKNSDNVYTLNRYATVYNIVGGFSKLLSYFQKNNDYETVISFADLRWSNGDVYKRTGWVDDKIIRPDYSYVVNKERVHKFNYRHTSGLKNLPNYDSTISEHQNMLNHNLYRIYDCGKIRFKYN